MLRIRIEIDPDSVLEVMNDHFDPDPAVKKKPGSNTDIANREVVCRLEPVLDMAKIPG